MKKYSILFFLLILSQFIFASEFLYDDFGYPTQKIEVNGDKTIYTNFVFKDNKLSFVTKVYEGEETPFEIEYYLKSPINNSLIGVKRYEGTNLVGGNYLYSEETLFLNASDNLVFTSDFEVSSDGIITLTDEKGDINTYSGDGLLISKENSSYITDYSYDDKKNLVFSVTKTTGTDLSDTRTEIEYKEEKKFVETVFRNDVIASRTTYYLSGKETTIYENGKELAVVVYYQDNKRVKEVRYL